MSYKIEEKANVNTPAVLLCAAGGKRKVVEVEQLNKTLVAEFERLKVCECKVGQR
jgi:hypothetical protein